MYRALMRKKALGLPLYVSNKDKYFSLPIKERERIRNLLRWYYTYYEPRGNRIK